MALERLDLLVRRAREQSGNRTYSSTQGVQQREFVRYANDAQKHLFGQFTQTHSSLYNAVYYINTVANQASYTLDTAIYLKSNVIKAEYSPTGDARLYRPLSLRTPKSERSVAGYPDSYFLRDGALVVSPYPMSSTTNGIRVEAQYKIPTLDIRRGTITARSLSGSALTSITLSSTGLITETEDDLSNGWVDYISVVDINGAVLCQDIRVSSYNSSTNVINVSKTLDSDETVPVDAYVVFGAYATTHSMLPENCDRYIVQYMSRGVQSRDSNQEAISTREDMKAMEAELINEVNDLEEDTLAISILDDSMLDYAEDL